MENVLIQAGYADVAKAYILYRKQRRKDRNMKSTILDYKEIVNSYVKVEDWRVKENSTVTYSVGGLILGQPPVQLLPITGCLRFMTMKSQMHTEMRIFIFMTCPC